MNDEFELGEVVSASDVPNWARRQPKWKRLIDRILQLQPGQSQTVVFPNRKAAERARNTIRDNVNLRMGIAAVRTRVVDEVETNVEGETVPTGRSVVYLTRLRPEDVVEEKRELKD